LRNFPLNKELLVVFKIYTFPYVKKMLKFVERRMAGEKLVEIKSKSTFADRGKDIIINTNSLHYQHINIDNIFDSYHLSF